VTDRVGRSWGLAGALCVFVLVVDQIVKDIVEHHIVLGEQVNVLGPLKLTLSHNEGVAFGLANGGGIGLVVVTVIALGVVLWLFSRDPTRPGMWVATGLLAGGALGNLVDRIRHGHVTDFIELPHWPPFNLADCGITCGVAILLFIYIREAERAERES
jgi:signal peptidase II